jgi:hypothetical protein
MAVTLAALRKFALSLPDVTEQPHHHFGSWRVHGRIFATLPPGGQHVHVFVPGGVREQALALYPAFTEKLLWGGKVVGLRVAFAAAPPAAAKQLLRQAWEGKAPKSVLALLKPNPPPPPARRSRSATPG